MSVATSEAPVVSPAAPSTPSGSRLVPARVGTYRRNQTVFIPCEAWCDQDHMDTPYALEDIDHYSSSAGWDVGSILDPDTAVHELYVRVHSDPMSENAQLRQAHVLLGNGAPFDAYLTPDMADAAADELIAFAQRMKDAANVARQANQLTELEPRGESGSGACLL